jgi:hypothetical protein
MREDRHWLHRIDLRPMCGYLSPNVTNVSVPAKAAHLPREYAALRGGRGLFPHPPGLTVC